MSGAPAILAPEATLHPSGAGSHTVLISAGEASGEMYGAQLIEGLRRLRPELRFFGVGGERMRAAGCETVVDAGQLAVVGITEILSHLPNIYARFRELVRAMEARRPDVAVVIDSPAFNLRVAKEAHRRGIPVVYYVAPQFWAWRQWRARIIRRYVQKALVIFPFEVEFYRKWGVDAEYVGHPLADTQPQAASRDDFARTEGLDPSKDWVALLPGSRRKEVLMNLPAMLGAAAQLGRQYEFALPVASTLQREWMQQQVKRITSGGPACSVILTSDVPSSLVHSRAAVVASGTATVEAALAGTPFVVVYRVSPVTYALGRPLVHVKHFAMVNLIAGETVVPELVQGDFTAENVFTQVQRLLADGSARRQMMTGLARVRALLREQSASGGTAAQRAAAAVLQFVR
jgi:lipid-A-disaccharide synthase